MDYTFSLECISQCLIKFSERWLNADLEKRRETQWVQTSQKCKGEVIESVNGWKESNGGGAAGTTRERAEND